MLYQGFLAMALLTFWAKEFFDVGACQRCLSVPGPYAQGATSSPQPPLPHPQPVCEKHISRISKCSIAGKIPSRLMTTELYRIAKHSQ